MKLGIKTAILIFVLDQLTKQVMIYFYGVEPGFRREILPFFNLVVWWNPGVSFGMFADHVYSRYIFSVLAIAISILLFFWMKKSESRQEIFGFGMIIGGAYGNLVDRVVFGAVYDFLDFHLYSYHWPAFNIADAAICVGAILVIVAGIFKGKKI